MPRPLKFQQRLDRYPPILIRLLATGARRSRGAAAAGEILTDQQIATAGGLSIADVKRLSYSTSWTGLLDFYHPFAVLGCGIDLEKRRTFRRLEFMRRHGRFTHVRKSPLFDSQFSEMLEIWCAQ